MKSSLKRKRSDSSLWDDKSQSHGELRSSVVPISAQIFSMTKNALILGDTLAIAIIILIGCATHGETEPSFLPRMAAVFFPLTIAWFVLSPSLGLFRDENIHNARQLWRPALAALFAVPFAAVLRGLLLNAPIIPIFALVLSASCALGMLIWRAIYFWAARKS
jgi:hypothetical protein